jgi:hypothetical protein
MTISLGTKLECPVPTPSMPSLETNHPNCETAKPGPPRSAPPRARLMQRQTGGTQQIKDDCTYDEVCSSGLARRHQPPSDP